MSEAGPEGRTYLKRGKYSMKDRSEWIAVPVPDSGIPREIVEAARRTLLGYRAASKAANRFWELSGSIMRCAECGRVMNPQKTGYKRRSGEKGFVLYYRCPRAYGYDGVCSHSKNHRADRLEPAVWGLISGMLKDPQRIRRGLEQLLKDERRGINGDPMREQKALLHKLAEVDERRSSFQDMAADGLISFDELRTKLDALEETRQRTRRERDVLRVRRERLQALERDKNTLLDHYATLVPGELDDLGPQERHRVYKMLGLRVTVQPTGVFEMSGTLSGGQELSEYAPTSASGARRSGRS